MPASRPVLLVAAAWASASLLAALASESVVLRAVLCAPLALYWAGFALLSAIQPRIARGVEWHALAVAVSVATLIAGGFALNAAGALGPAGWSAWTAGATLLGAAIASLRGQASGAPFGSLPSPRPVSWITWAGCCVALALLLGAIGIAVHDARTWRDFAFTEFWLVPDRSPGSGLVTIGIRNAEARSMRYDLEIAADGVIVSGWQSVRLDPGESFVRQLPVAARFARLEGRLFASEQPGLIYRKVWLDRRGGIR